MVGGLSHKQAAQMKSIASGPRKAKDKKDCQSYGSYVNPRLFCGTIFLRSMASDESMPHMSRDHDSWAIDDGNHVTVANLNEMISITTLVTCACARTTRR